MGFRVYSTVPESWRELIKIAKEIEGWEDTSDYIRELIKKDLVAKGLLGVKNEEKEAVPEVG